MRRSVSHTYVDSFYAANNENCRRKLGLGDWDDEAQVLRDELFTLMSLLAYLLTYLPTYLLTYLLTDLLTYLPTYLLRRCGMSSSP